MDRRRWWARHAAVALVVAIAIVAAENLLVAYCFPQLARLTTDFSSAYLRRELRDLAAGPPPAIFFGDSVLWGYRLDADQTAVAILAARGRTCANLAFKSGNPPNDYALARLLVASSVRPSVVVIEVNQAVLNPADREYQTLHPGIAAPAQPFLTAADRARLTEPPPPAQADDVLASISPLYAMRSDVRETLFGDAPQAPIGRLTPDMFEGTYNLVPLTETNVGVFYLERAVEFLHRARIRTLAFLTPTNHALLHDYIDNPQYRANSTYLGRALQRRGAEVLDLDQAFPAAEFIDNAHLTAEGQRRLAALLGAAIGREPSPSLR
jgi:hypothetical protein